ARRFRLVPVPRAVGGACRRPAVNPDRAPPVAPGAAGKLEQWPVPRGEKRSPSDQELSVPRLLPGLARVIALAPCNTLLPGHPAAMPPATGPAMRPGDAWLREWPQAAAPADVGLRLVRAFLAETPEDPRHYKVACTWYGALALAGTLDHRIALDALA